LSACRRRVEKLIDEIDQTIRDCRDENFRKHSEHNWNAAHIDEVLPGRTLREKTTRKRKARDCATEASVRQPELYLLWGKIQAILAAVQQDVNMEEPEVRA